MTIVFSWVLISCETLIEIEPKSSISDLTFWQNDEDYSTYINGIYSRYRSHLDYMGFGEDRSEMWKQGINARFTPFQKQIINAGNSVDWTGYYSTIGHINLLLFKMGSHDFAKKETEDKIRSEAHALRAAIYFYIARIWGDVPLVLEPVISKNVELIPRTNVNEIFNQINLDIEKALSFSNDGILNKYKWTKPAILALKADVLMWSATVLGGGVSDFNEAIEAIESIESYDFSLLSNYGEIFDNKRNDEIIFSCYLNRSEYVSGQYNMGFVRDESASNADNYNELPHSLHGQQAYALDTMAISLFSKYPDDKRISRTYIPQLVNGEVLFYWPNKFIGNVYPDTRYADSDIILYRFSDILLLKAEAYAALGQLENSKLYLNKVRSRAGLPEFNAMDKNLLQKEILDERGRELFHEMKRWYDLRRAHALGIIDVYQYIPNLIGKTTPLYWPVNSNVLIKNDQLVQTEGYN